MILELNAHCLFSKWFAESGKMVKTLFNKLNAMAASAFAFVFVLIDGVESLATARSSVMRGSDPSDAIRVINALLTQTDQIMRHPNVVIMATFNSTDCIDVTFLSRADIHQFIGPSSKCARYAILKSCIDELGSSPEISPFEIRTAHVDAGRKGQTCAVGGSIMKGSRNSWMFHARSYTAMDCVNGSHGGN
jgi:SpoVK/Ycf46/Vps4 family AAA+-type ATPase